VDAFPAFFSRQPYHGKTSKEKMILKVRKNENIRKYKYNIEKTVYNIYINNFLLQNKESLCGIYLVTSKISMY